MDSFAVTGVGAIVGAFLLFVFYLAIRTEWPVNYASTVNDFGMIVNRGILKYTAFALGPVYLVSLLVSTTTARAGGIGIATGALIAGLHVARTLAVHLYRTIRYDRTHTRYPTILLDSVVGLGIILAGTLGGLGPGPFTILVPPLEEFFKALWTTIFVAILAIVALSVTRVQFDVFNLVRRSRREVGPDLLNFARKKAVAFGTEPELVEAILLAENLQRPRWFRRLERLKGRIFPAGSYGVVQVTSAKPLSDKESIDIAVSVFLAGAAIDHTNYETESRTLWAALRRYNDNPVFVDLCKHLYEAIRYLGMTHKAETEDAKAEQQEQAKEIPQPRSSDVEQSNGFDAQLASTTTSMLLRIIPVIPLARRAAMNELLRAITVFVESIPNASSEPTSTGSSPQTSL